jgi:hypothetical protein
MTVFCRGKYSDIVMYSDRLGIVILKVIRKMISNI